jgi:hypothetical protein
VGTTFQIFEKKPVLIWQEFKFGERNTYVCTPVHKEKTQNATIIKNIGGFSTHKMRPPPISWRQNVFLDLQN